MAHCEPAPASSPPRRPARPLRGACLTASVAVLAACAAGPDYVKPALELPAAYKEAGPWKTAEPRPAGSGQAWWTVYADPTLDTLMADAERANPNLRVAEAQYREAKALAAQARAGFWPDLGVQASDTRARTVSPSVKVATVYTAGLAASWEPDLWGAVRRSVESGEASSTASADDLAAARLSIQSALAQDYLQLRYTDRLRDLYAATTTAYTRALQLTRAQHAAGVALQSDVALAEAQLTSTQAQAVDLELSRAQLEHAIAVLTGRTPAQFSLAPADAQHPFDAALPATPVGLPSELLERRPDIAAAERRVAAANAQIGVARAAWFPTITLSAADGGVGIAVSRLLESPEHVWSVGAALAATLFDGGLRSARDDQAVAAYDAAAATYKQTVLAGFQQVEDELATLRILDQESVLQAQAVKASQQAEELSLRQYRAGTALYLSVITAQTLALSNERTAVQLRARELAASVSLIAATGGGWQVGTPVSAAPASSPAAAATAPSPVSQGSAS